MNNRNNYQTRLPRPHRPDYILALMVFILCLVGLVMVFSASVVKSYAVTGGETTTKFLYHQVASLALGIFGWALSYRIDYPHWRKIGTKFFAITVFLLILVLVTGRVAGGAQRWLDFGIISFQPAEAIKVAFIVYLSLWFEQRLAKINTFEVILPFMLMLAALSVLILMQPNLSTTLIIAATGLVIYFIAGANFRILGTFLVGGFFAVMGLIKLESYRLARLSVFLNPEADPSGLGYQITQSLIAVGNGGLFGVGFNQSRQKFLYLPEVTTDAIFPIIAEELGFLRSLLILGLFLVLIIRGYKIAKNAPDDFSRFVAVGISTWFLVQIFINIGAMVSILPLTGVPLIFVSFGGSSLLFSLFAVGILLNISKYTKEEVIHANSGSWRGNWGSYLSYFSGSRRTRKKRR
ncbi:TPA: stage V sporulation protein E [candidate division CPR2 bacterium]|nr:MAG: Cell division-specific peptidoglycan biosynthesis regulator FtsW [candidate division CPR2 bacterium GW2011_GWD1_39_7]KKR29140.1 MAG: Cell division-specific peptidoglycan biosynthesis regulator FtsW [candidate division CPR2 bacterium GW2011_GWD2_39_7]OGB60078.1 MAG: hypothetical protein A2Y27_02085 [candidate division CPR2 bacterium GWD1_39_7]OGB70632.1 MAG: hypothetical protein A2Y26_01380 [candidate division CPR2 bacterium GWD2_39_7]HBG81648.1 stage V sporulation protein E [candidate d